VHNGLGVETDEKSVQAFFNSVDKQEEIYEALLKWLSLISKKNYLKMVKIGPSKARLR
jgi:hypothetical protein